MLKISKPEYGKYSILLGNSPCHGGRLFWARNLFGLVGRISKFPKLGPFINRGKEKAGNQGKSGTFNLAQGRISLSYQGTTGATHLEHRVRSPD